MSDPRYRPRSYTTEENAFGKALNIHWVTPGNRPEAVHLTAAQLQHRYAVRINRRLRDLGKSLREYSVMTGVSYDRMTKVLRGEAVMRLEDITEAQLMLGHILEGSDKSAVSNAGFSCELQTNLPKSHGSENG